MALLAAIAKLAVMDVLAGMACHAGGANQRGIFSPGGRMFVTAFTRYCAVRTVQPVA